MFFCTSETTESAASLPARSAREEQRRRNAAARRKLEVLRERKFLRKELTDVWDEPGNQG